MGVATKDGGGLSNTATLPRYASLKGGPAVTALWLFLTFAKQYELDAQYKLSLAF